MERRESKLVLFSAALPGYTRATSGRAPLAIAAFMDDWYRGCSQAIRARSGRLVKYLGDGCLATFPEDGCVDAVDAATELRHALGAVQSHHPLQVELAVNVHLATVAEGHFGPQDDRRYDVLGNGVNELFLMGGGPGIRISSAVYQHLPDDRRAAWTPAGAPAIYTLVS
jgi:class 3 adenylate cyclase